MDCKTAEELFDDLYQKYVDEFDWCFVPFTNQTFVSELKKELGTKHKLYHQQIYAVYRCESNDDVLFVIDSDKNGNDIYCIYHLTWSGKEESGSFPLCKERFVGIDEVKKYFEKELSD
ncbi:MAG: hypothetical protein IJ192_01830 [Clostridia bacterium]|nr:hypothetical protein [Clostridia bacterium]